MKAKIFYFILGAIIFSSITAIAVTKINANEISYIDKNNNEITVDQALNDLYSITDTYSECIKGWWNPTSAVTTNAGDVIEDEFAPTYFALRRTSGNTTHTIIWIKDIDGTANFVENGGGKAGFTSYFSLTEHGLKAHNWGGGAGERYLYVACK